MRLALRRNGVEVAGRVASVIVLVGCARVVVFFIAFRILGDSVTQAPVSRSVGCGFISSNTS